MMRPLLRLICFNLFLLVFMYGKAAAQTSTNPGNKPLNIAVINSLYFQENNGVKKLIDIQKKVETEYKPRFDELKVVEKKVEDLRKIIESSTVRNEAKIEEYEKLNRDFLYKREDFQAQYNKRYDALVRPVYTSMVTAMQQWCRQKGFDMVMDISKDEKGMIVWMEEQKINELTDDLIKHFNTVL